MAAPPFRKIFLAMVMVCVAFSVFFTVVYSLDTLKEPTRFFGILLGNALVGLAYSLIIWKMVNVLNQRHPWEQRPGLRFVLEFVGLILIVIVVATLTLLVWAAVLGEPADEAFQKLRFAYYVNSCYIPFIVTLFVEASGFLRNWRQALLRAERLRFSDLQTRHAYLQNQIKPHFLFNSLNVLASLVHKDPELAEKFINELSKLYRRLLEMDSREIVPLQEEMDAFASYLFLVKMRFGDALKVEISNFEAFRNYYIPPFTLQLLLENAVKHNDMAQDQPMVVRVEFEGNYVLVANTFRPKARASEKSTGIGLKNLRERYALMSRNAVLVEAAQNEFKVRIPLLESAEPADMPGATQKWSSRYSGYQDNWEKTEKVAADGSVIIEEKWTSKSPYGEQSWTRQRRKKQKKQSP